MRLVDPNLEETYRVVRTGSRRAAAEIAYALGIMCKKAKDYEGMREYRQESISLFVEIGVSTLEEACPVYFSINNVIMPELIHEGVVARDLSEPE